MMTVKQLVYRSRPTNTMSAGEVFELVRRCQSNNWRQGISGLLIYRGGYFLQMIEGDPSSVDGLYDRISKDSRHTEIVVLGEFEAEAACLPTWAMGYFCPDRPKTPVKGQPFVLSLESVKRIVGILPPPIGQFFSEALDHA